jgi:hypothetical protein
MPGLGDLGPIDPWETPDEEDYEEVDMDLLTKLVVSQIDDLRPVDATVEFADIRQTARVYVAFNITGWESRRRVFAQKVVAGMNDKTRQAVQDSVRTVYDEKVGRKSAQELFEEDLEEIDQAYRSHLEAR